MNQSHIRKLGLAVLLWLCLGTWTQAQTPTDNSPYSRYGLGDMVSPYFGALDGLGGISNAYNRPSSINLGNPASLGFINTTAFEVGLYTDISWLNSGDDRGRYADGNLSHMALGFPLQNSINRLTKIKKSPFNWGSAFGLIPYSRVGYSVETENSLPNIDTVRFQYEGSGGLYQLFVSNGVSYRNTSIGATFGYLFGNITQERRSIFVSTDNAFTNLLTRETNMTGWVYNLGIQHQFILNNPDEEKIVNGAMARRNKTRLTLGATFNNDTEINTAVRTLDRRYNGFYGFDTIVNNANLTAPTTLPMRIGMGVSIEKDDHWLLGIDYSMTRWSNYQNDLKPDSLANTFRIGFGAEYTPDANAYNKYFKRVAYRVGGYYELDPRVIDGEQISIIALTAGMGLPITLPKKGTVGHANISIEGGRLGYNTAIGETYFKTRVAFTLNDNSWFYKRQFN